MADSHDVRFGRLFAALAARDLETARQQMDILNREAPGDRRLGDAAAQLAAATGRLRSIPGHLSTAAGVVSGSAADFPPIAAPPTSHPVVVTDHPDPHTLRRIGPGNHGSTVIQDTQIADSDWSGLSIGGLAFAAATFNHLRIGDARLDATVWDRCIWNAVNFSPGFGETMVWSESEWSGVIANGTDLARSRWHRHRFRLSQLMNANFELAILSEVQFAHCEILGARFDGAALIRVRFGHHEHSELPLGQVSFRNALLVDCDLTAADLTGADFSGAVVIHTALPFGSTEHLSNATVLPRSRYQGNA